MMSRASIPFPSRTVVDLRSRGPRGAAGVYPEWYQPDIGGGKIRVYGGPVMWSNVRLDDSSAYYDVDYSALATDDERWLFAEIDLKNQTVTPKLQADNTLPADDPDNYLVRWRLSQWKRTATGISRLATAWPGGCIHFPAILGPPM
jgi:hypothetical protein